MKNEIKNDRVMSRSGSPKEIIVAPLFNLMAIGTGFKPSIVRASYKYSWEEVQNYFYYVHGRNSPPMHTYCELLESDYVMYFGAPFTYRSWWLAELAAMRVMHNDHKDAILVVCQDDWRLEPVERRMLRGLCNFVISPLMKLYGIGRERVLHVDSVLVEDAAAIAKSQDKVERRFDLQPSTYYDHNWLQVILKDYKK